jgi:hypothetical protein
MLLVSMASLALAPGPPRGSWALERARVATRSAARACEGCGAGDGESTPLQRFPASGGSGLTGLGCIPVPLERLLAPGARRSMHLYDLSCMAVFAHAMARCDGRFAMAALDPAAAEQRRFGLLPVACEVAVLSWEPSTHQSKFGDVSSSIRAEVVGCGRLSVPESSNGVRQCVMRGRLTPVHAAALLTAALRAAALLAGLPCARHHRTHSSSHAAPPARASPPFHSLNRPPQPALLPPLRRWEPVLSVAPSPFASFSPPSACAAAASRDSAACASLSASVLRLRGRLGLPAPDGDGWQQAVGKAGAGAKTGVGMRGQADAERGAGEVNPVPRSQRSANVSPGEGGAGAAAAAGAGAAAAEGSVGAEGGTGAAAPAGVEGGVLSADETRRLELRALGSSRLLPAGER